MSSTLDLKDSSCLAPVVVCLAAQQVSSTLDLKDSSCLAPVSGAYLRDPSFIPEDYRLRSGISPVGESVSGVSLVDTLTIHALDALNPPVIGGVLNHSPPRSVQNVVTLAIRPVHVVSSSLSKAVHAASKFISSLCPRSGSRVSYLDGVPA